MYSNKIDFNDASIEWNKNKIKNRNGYYQYKCKLCDEPIYWYTITNKYFDKFASEFDYKNKNNPRQHEYCEDHL